MGCTMVCVALTVMGMVGVVGAGLYFVMQRIARNVKGDPEKMKAVVDVALAVFHAENDDAGDEVSVPEVPQQAANQP